MKFLWGAATSSHQIEGGNRYNDWWQWEQEGNIEGGETSGAACDHWNLFREDLRLAQEMGLTSYRFSIEWSRLEPEEGQWCNEAFEWYEALVAECERRKLLPMATLHHFTVPQWFARRGGFTWEQSPGRFAGYVKKVITRFGARIPLWCTLNEPNTLVIGQYLGSYMPPATHDPKLASLATRNLLRAHVQAYDTIHGKMPARIGPWKDMPLAVGIAHNMIDFVPLRRYHPLEVLFTRVFRRFYNQTWPDAVTGKKQHFGVLGLLPYAAQVQQARGRNTVDFFGINYYTRVYVSFRPRNTGAASVDTGFPASSTLPIGVTFSRPSDITSDLGWVINPRGLGRMIRFLKRYRLPLYITENGIADASDAQRPAYLISHLKAVADEVVRGADVRGYYHWSLLDNFEWVKGFAPRFGLLEVDYGSMGRQERSSARLYRGIIAAHQSGMPCPELLARDIQSLQELGAKPACAI